MNSSNPQTKDVFPFICVFWSLLPMFCNFQCMSFVYYVKLHLIFYSFCCYCELNCFLNFLYSQFLYFVLFVYRNMTDFCMLILYPLTLLNSFINSNSSGVASVGFSKYNIVLPANTVLLFFSNLDSFFFFLLVWLLWLGLPIQTMLEKKRWEWASLSRS